MNNNVTSKKIHTATDRAKTKPVKNKMQPVFLSEEEERQFFRDAKKILDIRERLIKEKM